MPTRGAKLALVVCHKARLVAAKFCAVVSKKFAVAPWPGVGGGLISQRIPYVAVRRLEMRQVSSTNKEASRKMAEANCGDVAQGSCWVPQLLQKFVLFPLRSSTVSTNSVDVPGSIRARGREAPVVGAELESMCPKGPGRGGGHVVLGLAPNSLRARDHLADAGDREANQVIADAMHMQKLERRRLQIAGRISARSGLDSKPRWL